MFKYFLYIHDEYVEVDEKFFFDLICLYRKKFGIWKFNYQFESYCEADMVFDEPLYYYLRDTDKNKLLFFAKVYKVQNCETCLHYECDQNGCYCSLLTKDTSYHENRNDDCYYYSEDLTNSKKANLCADA